MYLTTEHQPTPRNNLNPDAEGQFLDEATVAIYSELSRNGKAKLFSYAVEIAADASAKNFMQKGETE